MSRLPPPRTAVWDWQLDAACRDIDSTTFFHPDHERGLAKDDRDRLAKAICSGCPVIEACRRHALIAQEPYGVWGGLTVAERAALLAPATRIVKQAAVTEPPQAGERVAGDAWFRIDSGTRHLEWGSEGLRPGIRFKKKRTR